MVSVALHFREVFLNDQDGSWIGPLPAGDARITLISQGANVRLQHIKIIYGAQKSS
jgi:hypothetical protein